MRDTDKSVLSRQTDFWFESFYFHTVKDHRFVFARSRDSELYDREFSFERNCVLRRWESKTLVPQHFNLPNHSQKHMAVCGLSLHLDNTESRKLALLIMIGNIERFSFL